MTANLKSTETLTESRNAARVEQTRAGILWVHPEARFLPIEDTRCVGRTSESDVVLADSLISRRHANFHRKETSLELEDLGSKNGSYVNAGRVTRAELIAQDVVRLGDWLGVVVEVPVNLSWGAEVKEAADGWLLGPSAAPRFANLEALARSPLSVVLNGETGTGKEVISRVIHKLSGRTGNLVAFNCAAIVESIAEAQLFGHVKGAFTGAHTESKGLVELADQGTLFLDEVADLSPQLQVKLLRVLEERAVLPVGSHAPRSVDFRVVCATQERLEELVERGEFRGDLMARLSGAEINMPPLRERKEEILPLFLRYLKAAGGGHRTPSAKFVERLLCYDFPYNVRELVQLAGRLAIVVQPLIGEEEFPERASLSRRPPADSKSDVSPGVRELLVKEGSRRESWLHRNSQEFQRLRAELDGNGGNVAEAARALGIPRYRAVRLIAAAKELSERIGVGPK